ncbi:Tyrosyl-DNA phosphodiesterase [Oesophagostomum dentatum]|uniref:Tyrosyl-DNA phosphodiesterase n=1 Tax=Oesophagostomum dentatum TaxID=61180 RepID=A0A0B1T7V3_OESDE|nr:Tyrosyl-DNA phosphodiesterase [Oesophagostomum dentatum]
MISTYINSEEMFESVLEGYRNYNAKQGAAVIKKLDEIRLRGRKRDMTGQYPAPCRQSPMVLVVGEKMGSDKRSLQQEISANKWSNVSVHGARLPLPFGTHHTKLSIFESETGLHIIVSTANLVEGDWDQKTQCFYYASGPFLNSGSVATEKGFSKDLCDYLSEYHLSDLTYWIDRIKNCDLSDISDRLVFSVPGYHQVPRLNKFGHPSLAQLLRNRPVPEQSARRLFLAQCSSIGSLGAKRETWLLPQFLHSLQGAKEPGLVLKYVCYR